MPILTVDIDRLALDASWTAAGIKGHVEASAAAFATATGLVLGNAALTFDAEGIATADLHATTGDLEALRYRIVVTYTETPSGKVRHYVSGWFSLVADAAFHTLATIGLPPTPDTAASKTALDAHTTATTNVHGIPDTSALETKTGAQAKADVVGDALTAHEESTTAHPATSITVAPTSLILSTDVQAALAEVAGVAANAIPKPAGATAGDTLVHTGTNWVRAAAKTFYITGNPNGVVTAPVGSRAINTEAGGWNGARVWRKDSGTGSTGWEVQGGSTPRLNIASLVGPDWAVSGGADLLQIKRLSGSVVALTVRISRVAAGGSRLDPSLLATLPNGFRIPPYTTLGVAPVISGALSGSAPVSIGDPGQLTIGQVTFGGSWAIGDRVSFSIVNVTDDNWPATITF